MSERIAEVIELNLEKCPNSDNLSIQKVEGFQLIVRTEDWKDHKLAVFIRADEGIQDAAGGCLRWPPYPLGQPVQARGAGAFRC